MEITSELTDLVVMQSKHTMPHIFFLKKLATGLPVAKTLIEYNNSLEENDEEEKESISFELTEIKEILIMIKMLLTLNDQMYNKKMRRILFWLTSLRACKSKLMSKILQKK